jgi:cytoskeletal protein CcmA (bactofilin family)
MLVRSLLLALTFASATALAADTPTQSRFERDAGGDRFAAGDQVNVSSPVAADLLAAGGNVEVDTRIGGDVLVAGGNVRLKGDVESGVIAGGGQVTINARIKRSVRAAGGQVEIGPKAELGGNLSVAGGQVRIEGPVFGYVQAAGGNVTLDGSVGGDVWATGGRLSLGPNARIAGKLHYASRGELNQDPAAVVQGGIEHVDFDAAWPREHREQHRSGFAGWLWITGLMVLAALLVALAPDITARTSRVLRERPAMSLLIGFVVLVCVPIAALILLVTLIGFPLALLAMLLYPVLLLVGYVSTSIGVADWALQRFVTMRTITPLTRAAAAAAGMFLVALVARLPAVGGFLAFLALLVGLGALALQWRKPAAA